MNDDAFEKKLESLAGALPLPDPTPQWKADILARARREADAGTATTATTTSRRILPPRWLMTVWCAAWVIMAFMHFSMPADDTRPTESAMTLAGSKRTTGSEAGPRGDVSSSLTLLALNRELSAGTITTFDIP